MDDGELVRARYDADERAALLRFLRLAEPRTFQMAAVEVLSPHEREALIRWLRACFPGRAFIEVSLAALPGGSVVDEVSAALTKRAASASGAVLVLTDLEEVQASAAGESPRIFAQLNVQRDLFVQAVSMPILLCAHPAALLRLSTVAPDFYDFLSTRISALPEPEGGAPRRTMDPRREAPRDLSRLESEVKRLRELVQGRSAAYLADLARALDELALQQALVGDDEAAQANAREAVAILRHLVSETPGVFEPDLARALRRHGAAAELMTEALRLYESLAERDPGTYLAELAECVVALARHQLSRGRYDDAKRSAERALDLYRQVREGATDRLSPAIARTWGVMAAALRAQGRLEEALRAAQEAVVHVRRSDEVTDLLERIDGLATVSDLLERLGRLEEALHVHEERASLCIASFSRAPLWFSAALRASLAARSRLLVDLGRLEEALTVASELVEHDRRAMDGGSLTRLHRASSLSRLAAVLLHLGRPQEAKSAAEEAVGTFDPGEWGWSPQVGVEAALGLADALERQGLVDDALQVLRRALVSAWEHLRGVPTRASVLFPLVHRVRALHAACGRAMPEGLDDQLTEIERSAQTME